MAGPFEIGACFGTLLQTIPPVGSQGICKDSSNDNETNLNWIFALQGNPVIPVAHRCNIFEIFFYRTTNLPAGNTGVILHSGTSQGNADYVIIEHVFGDMVNASIRVPGSSGLITASLPTSTEFVANRWMHLVIRRNSNTAVTFYLGNTGVRAVGADAGQVVETPDTFPYTTNITVVTPSGDPWFSGFSEVPNFGGENARKCIVGIASRNEAGADPLLGGVCEMRWWDTDLADATINNNKDRFVLSTAQGGSDANLAMCWRLNAASTDRNNFDGAGSEQSIWTQFGVIYPGQPTTTHPFAFITNDQSVDDGVLIGDSVNVEVTYAPDPVDDGVLVGDSVSTEVSAEGSVSDGLLVGDSYGIAIDQSVADEVLIGEVLSPGLFLYPGVADSLLVGDSVFAPGGEIVSSIGPTGGGYDYEDSGDGTALEAWQTAINPLMSGSSPGVYVAELYYDEATPLNLSGTTTFGPAGQFLIEGNMNPGPDNRKIIRPAASNHYDPLTNTGCTVSVSVADNSIFYLNEHNATLSGPMKVQYNGAAGKEGIRATQTTQLVELIWYEATNEGQGVAFRNFFGPGCTFVSCVVKGSIQGFRDSAADPDPGMKCYFCHVIKETVDVQSGFLMDSGSTDANTLWVGCGVYVDDGHTGETYRPDGFDPGSQFNFTCGTDSTIPPGTGSFHVAKASVATLYNDWANRDLRVPDQSSLNYNIVTNPAYDEAYNAWSGDLHGASPNAVPNASPYNGVVGTAPQTGTVTDGILAGDLVVQTATVDRSETDGVLIGDSVAPELTHDESVSDGVLIGDSESTIPTFPRQVEDGVLVGDSIATDGSTFNPTRTDGVLVGDSAITSTESGTLQAAIASLDNVGGIGNELWGCGQVCMHALGTTGASNTTGTPIQDNDAFSILKHGCKFEWNQISGPTISAGTRWDSTPIQWRGPWLTLFLDQAGTYVFEVTVTDPDGNQSTSSPLNVVVNDISTHPDYVLYTVPGTHSTVVSAFSQVLSDSDGAGGQIAREIRLGDGYTETLAGDMNTFQGGTKRDNFDRLWIRAAPGASVRPLLTKNAFGSKVSEAWGTKNVTWQNLRFNGSSLARGFEIHDIKDAGIESSPENCQVVGCSSEATQWYNGFGNDDGIPFQIDCFFPQTENTYWDYTAPGLPGSAANGQSQFRLCGLWDCDSTDAPGLNYVFWLTPGIGSACVGNSFTGNPNQHIFRINNIDLFTLRNNDGESTGTASVLKLHNEHTGPGGNEPFAEDPGGAPGSSWFPDGIGSPHQNLLICDNRLIGPIGLCGQQSETTNSGEMEDILIERNWFEPGGSDSRIQWSDRRVTVRNNIINVPSGSLLLGSTRFTQVTNFTQSYESYGNTIVHSNASVGPSTFVAHEYNIEFDDGVPDPYVQAEWDHHRIHANIVHIESAIGNGPNRGLYSPINVSANEATLLADLESDYNTVSGINGPPDLGTGPVFAYAEGSSRGLTGTGGWRDSYSLDLNGSTADPQLVDVVNEDFNATQNTPTAPRWPGHFEDFYYATRSGATTTIGAAVFDLLNEFPSDGILVGDGISTLVTYNPSRSDGVLVGDSLFTELLGNATLADGVLIGDSETHEISAFEYPLSGVLLGDSESSSVVTVEQDEFVTDGVLFGDSVSGAGSTYSASLLDAVLLGDDGTFQGELPDYQSCWAGEYIVSALDVVNGALIRLSQQPVQSVDQAPIIKNEWVRFRRLFLSRFKPNGAQTYQNLTQIVMAAPPPWDYWYHLPYDFLTLVSLNEQADVRVGQHYAIKAGPDKDRRFFLTNESEAKLWYVFDDCNLDLLNPEHVEGMAVGLALQVANLFHLDSGKILLLKQDWKDFTDSAALTDHDENSVEQRTISHYDDDMLQARR